MSSVTQQNIPYIQNADNVIMFTDKKSVTSVQGVIDLPSLYSFYKEDPDKNHRGLMQLWGQQSVRKYGNSILRDLLLNKDVLEVNGWDGGFTYDLPINDFKGCYVTRDTSSQAYPGIDGGTFKLVLNKAYTTGDRLSYDKMNGQEIIVSGEEPVVAVAEGFEHTVTLVDNDKNTYFIPSYLAKGTQFFKVGHAIMGERGTNFSNFDLPDTVGSMRCEFRLGAFSGVEAYMTGMASEKKFSGGDAKSQQYLKMLQDEFQGNEYAILAPLKMGAGGKKVPNMAAASLGATMEFLTMRELERITSERLMWGRAGQVKNVNGTIVRLNEGLWHQLRRGKVDTYARPGGITKAHIKSLAEYIFRANPYKQDVERRLKLKCGKFAYANILEIFSEEVNFQNAGLKTKGFLGDVNQIPSPVKGNDLFNLEYQAVRFTKVFLPGIGNVEIEEDTSLNMVEGIDRFAGGMHPEGYSHTAYSVVVYDVDSQEYSNNKELPKGATLMEGGNSKANIHLVKPQGENVYWGSTNGRYDYRKAGDIISSAKQIGQEYWAYQICDIHVDDVTRFAMLELDPAAKKGFN